MKIKVVGSLIKHGNKILGPVVNYITDPHEFKSLTTVQGVSHITLPHNIDLVFAAGQKVVTGEFKRPKDLVSSHQTRRLQRQLRNMREVSDVVVLFIRGIDHVEIQTAIRATTNRTPTYNPEWFWGDLANIQSQGVYVLPLSDSDKEAVEELRYYRKALAGSGARGMKGTDTPKSDRLPGWPLRRIAGVGPVMSQKLLKEYGSVGNVIVHAEHQQLAGVSEAISEKFYQAYWAKEAIVLGKK